MIKYSPREIAERVGKQLKPWRLAIYKDGKRMVCIRSTVGDTDFIMPDSPFAVYGGEEFLTEEEAMWVWDVFKNRYPKETEGWEPYIYQYEV